MGEQRARRGVGRGTARCEQGQVLVLFVLGMAVLLGCCALVLDVGMAWYAKRQLQASVDAAALAGAQDLPSNSAGTTALSYLQKNPIRGTASMNQQIVSKCLSTAPGCNPSNAIQITASATVNTYFAKLFGIGTWHVSAKATACQPCSGRPLDVMIVLDRTGSMSEGGTPNKLANAKSGIQTLLGFLDAGTDRVGLAVTPPSSSIGTRCSTPPSTVYDSASSVYTVVPLSTDYEVNGALNPSSNLISTLNCLQPSGTTAYADALESAQAELDKDGRANVQDVIVFLTDGAANTGPHFYASSSPYRTQPCHQGVTSAGTIKNKGTWVYTIGYAIGSDECQADRMAGAESPAITPDQALAAIASKPQYYYVKPDTGQLNTIFNQVAVDINQGASRLVDNGWG
jgi:Flp pilus assembly protein TadG